MRQCGKNIVAWGRAHMAIWCMRIACWVTKATNTHTHTHSRCVLLIAFPLQQRLHEHAPTLHDTYIDCNVKLQYVSVGLKSP